MCFVSAAERVRAAKHGQLIATAETIALLRGQGPQTADISKLPIPCGRPFTLGTRRLELVRSGTSVGGASLLVTVDDRRVLYAGAVNPRGCGLDGAADVRACDTLVVSAEFGDPRFRFDEPSHVADALAEFSRDVLRGGGIAIVLVDTVGKGLDVAGHLAGAGLEVCAHRAIHHAAQRLRAVRTLAPLQRWSGTPRPGKVLLWLSRSVDALDALTFPAGSKRAFVSGRAADAEVALVELVDRSFAWSEQADHQRLLEYIDATGATEVFLTHRFAEPLAAQLDAPKRRVRPLGPPRQMNLF